MLLPSCDKQFSMLQVLNHAFFAFQAFHKLHTTNVETENFTCYNTGGTYKYGEF